LIPPANGLIQRFSRNWHLVRSLRRNRRSLPGANLAAAFGMQDAEGDSGADAKIVPGAGFIKPLSGDEPFPSGLAGKDHDEGDGTWEVTYKTRALPAIAVFAFTQWVSTKAVVRNSRELLMISSIVGLGGSLWAVVTADSRFNDLTIRRFSCMHSCMPTKTISLELDAY